MQIYKHLTYNPFLKGIREIIIEAQDTSNLEGSPAWCFLRCQPVTQYEWVAIFERETPEYGLETPTSDTLGDLSTSK